MGILPLLIGCLKDTRLLYFKPWSKDKTLTKKSRDTYKAIEQGVKIFVNVSYGVLSHKGFGFYCPPVSESITAHARQSITKLAIKAEEMNGNNLIRIAEEHKVEPLEALEYIDADKKKILIGDTDSLAGHFTNEEVEELKKFSEEELECELELEITAPLAIFHKKKNYILVDEDGEVEVKGMLGKKRNTPPISTKCFDEFKDILSSAVKNDDIYEDRIRKETVELVRRYYNKIWYGEGDIRDYAFEVRMTKKFSEYKVSPQHVAAAMKWVEAVKKNTIALRTTSADQIVPAGSYIKYVKKSKSGIKGKCDSIPIQLATKDDIGHSFYHENLLSVMGQVMEALNINEKEVITADPNQMTLAEFS
jgi:DNA polymerase I